MKRMLAGMLSMLWLAGCASAPPRTMKAGSIRIDHMVMPASTQEGWDAWSPQ